MYLDTPRSSLCRITHSCSGLRSTGSLLPPTTYQLLFMAQPISSEFAFTLDPAVLPWGITITALPSSPKHPCPPVVLRRRAGKPQLWTKPPLAFSTHWSRSSRALPEKVSWPWVITPHVRDHRLQGGFNAPRPSYCATGWHALSATTYWGPVFSVSFKPWTSVPTISTETQSRRLSLLAWRCTHLTLALLRIREPNPSPVLWTRPFPAFSGALFYLSPSPAQVTVPSLTCIFPMEIQSVSCNGILSETSLQKGLFLLKQWNLFAL